MHRELSHLLEGGRFGNVEPRHSRLMRSIRSAHTRPELVVRSLVHRMGYRYRLHRRDLPGRPDLVLTRHRKVIQVHGCFWHMHDCKLGNKSPSRNRDYWMRKRQGNAERDRRNEKALAELGWDVLVVWECETRRLDELSARLAGFLNHRAE